jgi:hypothetical protein
MLTWLHWSVHTRKEILGFFLASLVRMTSVEDGLLIRNKKYVMRSALYLSSTETSFGWILSRPNAAAFLCMA